MECLTSRSSIGLAGWSNPPTPLSGFTLFLRVHSARNLPAVGRGSYCKLYLGNSEIANGWAQAGTSFQNLMAVDTNPQQIQTQGPTHRVCRTKVVYTDQKSCPEWNDKLELHVLNPNTEILTVRVKNQLMLFCPVIGACAIPLCNIRVGELAEQWVPLYKEGKAAGHIRLQFLLKQKNPTMTPCPRINVNESPMERLNKQHCQQEWERRQGQRDEEAMRRHHFEEQEMKVRKQRKELDTKECTRSDVMIRMQTYQTQEQREEEAKAHAYLQKQMKYGEEWHIEGLAQQMDRIKVKDEPQDVRKKPNYLFADDMVTVSTSMRPSDVSAGRKKSFTGFQEDNQCQGQAIEAVEVTEVMVEEVVKNALPSLKSLSSGGIQECQNERKGKERRRQHSRKHSRSARQDNTRLSQVPLFPREKTTAGENLSSFSPADFSSSSEETSSSEEERRLRRRRRKEKKAKRKERRRKRKAKRKSRRMSDGNESLSSSSSYSSSSSSSSSTTDEGCKCKTRKHKKPKERPRSQHDGRASTTSRSPAPPYSNIYEPDLSGYAKGSTNIYDAPPPAYVKPIQSHHSTSPPPVYINSLPPQPQQKRSLGETISTAANLTSILSDLASLATSVQQLAGGGDAGIDAEALGLPFAIPDMSQILEA